MNLIDIIHLVSLGILFVAVFLILWRMAIGPTLLDRVVANDVLTAVALSMTAVLIVWWKRYDLSLVLVLLALTGFISSVVAARFVTRDVVGQRRILSREEAEEQQRQREREAELAETGENA